nr:MAG TPA: hypothetical protein [Caudoviricetes sp.]
MKAVLLSIRPKWCKLIWARMKTVEVRKTRPTLETPFKAYIYCTMQREGWFRHPGSESWCGKVIGEFVCDKITGLTHVGANGSVEPYKLNILATGMYYKPADALLQAACLTEAQAEKYLKGGDGYGWHISDLKIYDRPRPLSDFTRLRATKFGYEPVEIRRPPQSWFYVEDGR